jgi:group I intron endonuclease
MNSREAEIYSITSKVNGKRYIGSSSRICERWINHKKKLKANKHNSPQLQSHYNKYGLEDLIFSVVEIVERGDLTLQEFRELLLEREQFYLNNWNECQFNSLKLARSSLGFKRINCKYYHYHKHDKTYVTSYRINGRSEYFTYHKLEENAKSEVEYIKTLDEKQLVDYHNECKNRNKFNKTKSKNYVFNKKSNEWKIRFKIDGKFIYFGYCQTEQEAVDRVKYICTLNENEKLEYSKNYINMFKRKRNCKNYTFSKRRNKWLVHMAIKGKCTYLGGFETEQEAIDKVKQVKLELGID